MSYLIQRYKKQYNLYDSYKSENWSKGGTYGTCWDENGPSTLSEEDPISITDFYEFVNTLALISNNTANPLDYESCIEEVQEDEADYYGGCAYYGFYVFNTDILIKSYLVNTYGITNFSKTYVEKNYPELLI